MGKKQKSKSRLDKYYYLAKDHGFRSRATFKLIQLNKKYNFFANSTVCIDLCAAPGGWLQAATKLMPMSSIKIGVDLDPIKPIPGCTTFVSDITSQDCRNKLQKELKHMKADIVLNDGAPNVGGNWVHDAYTQSELVLHAVKLASEFLKQGGWFVTKVFRSSDYSSLIYVMNQLFKKVEATKPLASRQVSAEIFVVCQGFKGGDVDPKLLDPKYALKQLEDEEDSKMSNIKSIKALLEAGSNRNRGGYYSNSLFKEKEFSEFVECNNPYQFLYEVNKITTLTDKSKEYLNSIKQPKNVEHLFPDLKVLGKSELQTLIFWRDKIRVKFLKGKKAQTPTEEKKPLSEEEYKSKRLQEMDEEIKKIEKAKKKKLEVAEKKKEKNELRQKISFLKENNYFEVNKEDFDPSIFEYMKKNNINMEDLEYKELSDSNDDQDNVEGVEEIDLSELDENDYYDMMNKEVETNIQKYKEEKDDAAAKKAEQKKNKEKKKHKKRNKSGNVEDDVSDLDDDDIKVEQDEIKAEDDDEEKEDADDEYTDEIYDEDDEFSEDDDDYEYEKSEEIRKKIKANQIKENTKDNTIIKKADNTKEDAIKSIVKELKKPDLKLNSDLNKKEIKQEKLKNDKLIDKLLNKPTEVNPNLENSKKANKSSKNEFVNPLKKLKLKNKEGFQEEEEQKSKEKKQKIKGNQEDGIENPEDEQNMSSDTDDENKKPESKSLLKKKRKRDIETKNNELNEKDIEYIAPENNSDEDLDIDDIAEIRALAKKMLRKKDRLNILESSYNRYAFDDLGNLPDWFVEDEKQHSKPNKPVTKEEMNVERELLREMNARTPKKILEAKNRKKKRLARTMEKVKQKAQAIVNQDEVGEGSKLRQIEKLYKKELAKNKPQKKYVFVRAQQKVGKGGKNVKYVDKRLKKDKKAQKRQERNNKGLKNKKNLQKVKKTQSVKKGIKNRRR